VGLRQALWAALFDAAPAVRYQVGAPLVARWLPAVTRSAVGDAVLRRMMPMPVQAARL
jgi:hypothetical protein